MPINAILKQYNEFADTYAININRSMQLESLRKLYTYLTSVESDVSNKVWLDAGCGPGCLSKIDSIQKPKMVIGVDISRKMIQIADRNPFYNLCCVADISDLRILKDNSIDIYFSNSVFHWLNIIEHDALHKALNEAYRVLRPNGIIATSISGIGTAMALMECCHEVITRFGKENINYTNGNPLFKKISFRRQTHDLIGSENLYKLVDLFENTGFYVEIAKLEFEPVNYSGPSAYISDVEQYGKYIYLMSLQNLPNKDLDNIFQQIKQSFIKRIGQRQYRHKQYMIYIVARKK